MSDFKEVTVYSKYIVDGRWDILLQSLKILFGGELPTNPRIIEQIEEVFKDKGICIKQTEDLYKLLLTSTLSRDLLVHFTFNPDNFKFDCYVSKIRQSDK